MIKIIVAVSENNVIGDSNKLIWHLPEDLKRFKELTTNSTIIMGRKTHESIGRALPNRRNIVITRNTNYNSPGVEISPSLNDAIEMSNNNCFIIGGGEIYKQALEIANEIYLTKIYKKFEGDAQFPEIDSDIFQLYDKSIKFSNGEFEWDYQKYIKN